MNPVKMLTGILLCYSSLCMAAPPKVSTSIQPLHGIASAILQGVTQPETLIPANASPHHYHLKPSDIVQLQSSDLVIWIGPGLESSAHEAIHKIVKKSRQLQLMESQTNGHRHEHGHHHEHVSEPDPHLWLSPQQARLVAEQIAQRLTQTDPANSARYQANLQAFAHKSLTLETSLKQQLQMVQSIPFLVYHDGYRHFTDYFELNLAAAVSVNEHSRPGVKHIRKLRKLIREQNIGCLYLQPQIDASLADNISAGTNLKLARLDPLGSAPDIQTPDWFSLMNNLTQDFLSCLKP